MIELSPLAVICIMFGSIIVALLAGVPVVFAMGGIGVILLLLLWGDAFVTTLLVSNVFQAMNTYVLIGISLFVFMAMILESSGIIEELFRTTRLWLDRIPGGLAMAVVVASVFIGAMSGIIATGLVVLGIVAVPYMLKVGYSKNIAIGPILAGAALADLIPPSTGFIVYGAIAKVSIGQLFAGGLFPGLILAGLYILYIGIRCYLDPKLGPPLPPEERVGLREKFASLKGIIFPLILIVAVLGSIFMGIAAASEAAGVGALGALACAAAKGKLTWQGFRKAITETAKVTAMVMWIIFGAYCFKSVFVLTGAPHYLTALIADLDVGPLGIIALMQVVFITMGCFVQEMVIMLISVPVFLPIVKNLGFSSLWFGVLLLCNLQTASLTPPFGFGLFVMRSVAPKGVTMGDIIRSSLPFIPLQVIGIILVMFFPKIVLWLPNLLLS